VKGEVVTRNGRRIASPEYRSWQHMKDRCLNPRCKDWPQYGGRGIRMADDWEDFDLFLADMGRRPSRLHSLDRRDVNGNYDRDNCRWATKLVQNRNQRTTKLNGTQVRMIRRRYARGKVTQAELAARFGVCRQHISKVVRGVHW
jgi:integrase